MGCWVQVLNRFSNEWTSHSNVIDEKTDESIKFCCYCTINVVNPWILWKVTIVRLVKSSITSKETHQSWGGVEVGCFDSMCSRSLMWWTLNHFVTLYVKSQWLMMQGHVVPMSMINFCCWMRCMMKPIIIEKNCFLTISFMMCSMTRPSWCVLHQIWKREQLSCIESWSWVTTPTTCSIIFRVSSHDKPWGRIFQLGQNIVKKL